MQKFQNNAHLNKQTVHEHINSWLIKNLANIK